MRSLTPFALLLLGGCGGCSDGDDHADDPVAAAAPGGSPSGGAPGGGGGTFTSTGPAPDFWDSDMPLSTTWHAPAVASGQPYWRLVSASYYPSGSTLPVGGDHHIYFQAKDPGGALLSDKTGKATFYDNVVYAVTKGAVDGYYGNIPMYGTSWCTADIDDSAGPYSFEMAQDGLPSYRVSGMGLHCNHHLTWVLVFQKAVAP